MGTNPKFSQEFSIDALYDPVATREARAAIALDHLWFAGHPAATARVRLVNRGECPALDRFRDRLPSFRAFAILIHHARRGDKRADAGVGVYSDFFWDRDDEARRATGQQLSNISATGGDLSKYLSAVAGKRRGNK